MAFSKGIFLTFSKEKTSFVDDDVNDDNNDDDIDDDDDVDDNNNDDDDVDDDIDDCDFNQMRAKRMFHVSQFFSVVSKRRICQ